MPDMFTKEKRSQIMSSIKSSGSKMELLMKAALEKNNIAFSYQPKMFGKPDFLIGKKIVVFCDSSFWHGRNWQQLKKRLPDTYWREHIENNRKRDRVVNSVLKNEGYMVIRCWDEEITGNIDRCIARIIKSMNKVVEEHANMKGVP
jgi:DNA mismatch endonuclease (patch repair protein)